MSRGEIRAGSTMTATRRAASATSAAVKHDPSTLARQHSGKRHLARSIGVLGGAQRPAGDREDRRGELAPSLPVAVG